jgi:protein-tyrosine phosphatase
MGDLTPNKPNGIIDRMSTPERSLKLAGASNFRDLGGYVGHGGQAVRWRKLFRSDHLAALTPDDIGTLTGLGLTRVFDFRGELERAPLACALPNVTVHSLPIEPTVVQAMKDLQAAGTAITAQDTVRMMQETYRNFVHDNSDRYASLFEHLLANDTPLVFHCTAGKDRTGFAAALILLALGVPRTVVMQDYLLTNELYQRLPSADAFAPQEVLSVLWRVQEAFLDAAMHVVDADYGGVAQYLERNMGLGPKEHERLAALYLKG